MDQLNSIKGLRKLSSLAVCLPTGVLPWASICKQVDSLVLRLLCLACAPQFLVLFFSKPQIMLYNMLQTLGVGKIIIMLVLATSWQEDGPISRRLKSDKRDGVANTIGHRGCGKDLPAVCGVHGLLMLLLFLAVHFDSAPVSLNNEDVLIDVIVGSAASRILPVKLSLCREVREYNQLRVGVVPSKL